jgi:hypothetical protein
MQQEKIMSNTIAVLFGAALIVLSATPIATAAQRHHHPVRNVQRPVAAEQFRSSNNAIASPQQLPSYYHGGYSAPAGR